MDDLTEATSPAFELTDWHDQSGLVRQFSLHTETGPKRIPMTDLCHQLTVGRQSVRRLIREGQLRFYRVGRRYRFAAFKVNQHLKQISSQ